MRWLIWSFLCLSTSVAMSMTAANAATANSQLRVAVASNFAATAAELAQRFEAQTGHAPSISLGATAKHYVQIKHGAPFDVFLAADIKHPQLLIQERFGLAESRITYAIGQLALWRPKQPFAADFDEASFRQLSLAANHKLVIANPLLAPYGAAAQQALVKSDLWPKMQSQLVTGENVSQAYQFVASGAAQVGMVAWSQVLQHAAANKWKVPSHLYEPIEQQAIQLSDTPIAQRFMRYLTSAEAKLVIQRHGYLTP